MLIPRRYYKPIKKKSQSKMSDDSSISANKVTKYITENPETITAIVGLLFSCRHIFRSLIVNLRVQRERQIKAKTIYDPRTGIHYTLRRELNVYDYDYINRMRKQGLTMYDILVQLNAI